MIQAWWGKQTERDQTIMLIGALVAIVLVVYALIFQPLSASIQTLQKDVAQKETLLQWMQTTTKKIQILHASGFEAKNLQGESLSAFIDRSAKKNNLNQFIQQVKQGENNQVTVIFKQVPFDMLITWLVLLQKGYNIHATALSAKQLQKTGTIQATLTLAL